MKHNTLSENLLSRRRLLGRWALGGAAALALSACGGADGDGDDTADQEERLKAAYYKLESGMVWTDVEALVGFPANNVRSDTGLIWKVGGVTLHVNFVTTGTKVIAGASLKVGSDPLISRNIKQIA
jgi:hypothetical protein